MSKGTSLQEKREENTFGQILFSSRQISITFFYSLVFAAAIYTTLDYFFTPQEIIRDVDRLLNNSFCRIIIFIFVTTMLYGGFQYIGLMIDHHRLSSIQNWKRQKRLFYWIACSITGRSRSVDNDTIKAGKEWINDIHKLDDLGALNEYLLNLREQQYQQNLGPIQFAVWVMPLLGFIGTVIGITEAIKGLDDVLSEVDGNVSLDRVLDGLQFAFDTTFIGLILVIPCMIVILPLRIKGQSVITFLHQILIHMHLEKQKNGQTNG